VAYIFVHVLPTLQLIREIGMKFLSEFKMLFPEYSVYLWTMVGFPVFYGLETMWLACKEPRRITQAIMTARIHGIHG
jgi:hypothetical protein